MARQLADRCGARLAEAGDNSHLKVDDLHVFARWYNDGPELFDPWLLDANPRDFALQLIESRLEDLLFDNRALAARACIFLGDEAKPLLDSLPVDVPDSFYELCFGAGE